MSVVLDVKSVHVSGDTGVATLSSEPSIGLGSEVTFKSLNTPRLNVNVIVKKVSGSTIEFTVPKLGMHIHQRPIPNLNQGSWVVKYQ